MTTDAIRRSYCVHSRHLQQDLQKTTSKCGWKKTLGGSCILLGSTINFAFMFVYYPYFWSHHAHYRCVAFFMDSQGEHYVALRWYAETRITPDGCILELPALVLAPDNNTKSFSILPEACIINGAILIKCRGAYWAVQSPREELAYARNHIQFNM